MKIKKIDIQFLSVGSFEASNDKINGVHHEKVLPYLSIAQSVRGHYKIALDHAQAQITEEGGCFIAPSGKKQSITHLADHEADTSEFQWVFIEAIINNQFRLDDLYDFPVILPAVHQAEIYRLIQALLSTEDYCQKMLCGYRIIQILLSIAAEKQLLPEPLNQVLFYIHTHYAESLNVPVLAHVAHVSASGLYDLFRQHIGTPPMSYVISYRLEQASSMLINTEEKIDRISERVGFHNSFYFSKMFKKKYGCPPLAYRRQMQLS